MKVTTFVHGVGGNVTESQQFNAVDTGMFFMRILFDVDQQSSAELLSKEFEHIARELGMTWKIRDVEYRKKVLILVSKFDHCLGDLLYRERIGELNMEIVGVVSNHPKDALRISVPSDIPHHDLPITKETKPQQESQIKQIVRDTGAELIILARYMQILSEDFCEFLDGRCVNIHHSFLPGFKGAKPYHQAFKHGVKMIGATAHFVTRDLDEGPIIAQDVEATTHADLPEQLIKKGRDVERRVLSRAVSLLLEDRVFLNGAKTVVF